MRSATLGASESPAHAEVGADPKAMFTRRTRSLISTRPFTLQSPKHKGGRTFVCALTPGVVTSRRPSTEAIAAPMKPEAAVFVALPLETVLWARIFCGSFPDHLWATSYPSDTPFPTNSANTQRRILSL